MPDALLRRQTDRVIDGTNVELSAGRVAVKTRSRAAVRRKAQDLTAIRLAEAQFALPSGAPPPLPSPRHTPTLSLHATQCHPELPTVSAEEPNI